MDRISSRRPDGCSHVDLHSPDGRRLPDKMLEGFLEHVSSPLGVWLSAAAAPSASVLSALGLGRLGGALARVVASEPAPGESAGRR